MKKIFLFLFAGLLLTATAHAQQAAEEPATKNPPLYWRVQFFLRVNPTTFARHIESFLPPTTAQQEILSLKKYAADYSYSEQLSRDNTIGLWDSLEGHTGANWIIYDALAKIKHYPKPKALELSRTALTEAPFLELPAADKTALKAKIKQLDLGNKTLGKKIRILFDYVVNSVESSKESQKQDISKILELSAGDRQDKIHLFRAMVEELGIPTRLVQGLKLKDRTLRHQSRLWTELYLNDTWLPFDVAKAHFASLPQNYFTLGYGERPLLKLTHNTHYTHQFVITEMSEESAIDADDLAIPQDNLFDEKYFAGIQKQESFLKNAVGRIAIVTDDPVSKSVVEKITKQATYSDTKIYFYSAPYESTFFKGSYIAKLLSDNFTSLKSADAVFIQSNDDSGLYALFHLSKGHKKLKNTSIYLSGKFSEPVAHILGYSLYKLLKPKELFIIPEKVDIERAWDILQNGVLDAMPIPQVAENWRVPIMDLSQMGDKVVTSWRRFLVDTWVLAARAEVNLESVYLILILPAIALAVVVFRNVIGIETFGTFTPVIVSVAFLTTGLFWGTMLFAIIVATGIFFRQLFQRIHIHLVARMAMLIAVVGITMLVIIIFGVHMGWGALVNISILPMVIMAGIVENFTRTQMEVGFAQALKLTFFTLFVSAFSYLVIAGLNFPSLVLVFPELTLVAIGLELLIGRWNGLRLLEYLRFYKITSTRHA